MVDLLDHFAIELMDFKSVRFTSSQRDGSKMRWHMVIEAFIILHSPRVGNHHDKSIGLQKINKTNKKKEIK